MGVQIRRSSLLMLKQLYLIGATSQLQYPSRLRGTAAVSRRQDPPSTLLGKWILKQINRIRRTSTPAPTGRRADATASFPSPTYDDKTKKAISIYHELTVPAKPLHAIVLVIYSIGKANMPSETLTLSADAGPRRLHEARTHRKVQPVVMIFDSKPRYPRKKHAKKPKTSCTTTSGKAFAFVHTSRPGKADEESRRLVKTHVMQDVLRRKSGGCSKLEVGSPTSLCLCPDSLRSKGGSPQAPPSYLLIFPIQTEPYMLRLVHDCA